jgi:hypothetical protein
MSEIEEESAILGESVSNLIKSNQLLIEALAHLINLTDSHDDEIKFKLQKAYQLFTTAQKGLKKIKFFEDIQ